MRSILILLFLTLAATAGARPWRNIDGSKSFTAEILANDGTRVTLKRADGRIITFPLGMLHAEDREWIGIHHPPAGNGPARPTPKGAAFDTLEFGDSRATVESKLEKSNLVTTNVGKTLFGRTGLNGIFRTKATIGGLHCYLFFDWSASGNLREVSLQTQPVNKSQYRTNLRGNWYELIDLLSKLHGRPLQAAEFPGIEDLQNGLILGSHLWRTDEGHSVILGTGQEGAGYNVVVRITTERIQPALIQPAEGPSESLLPKAGDFQP